MDLTNLIESIDIVDFISQYTELKEKSDGEFWGLSPLKEEKTPSFSVSREKNSFYDFSTGIGGNVLTFVRYYNKCGNDEAAEFLKGYSNCDESAMNRIHLPVTDLLKRISRFEKTNHKTGSSVILSDNYMDRYEKDSNKLKIWEDEGISRESLDKFQVYYDRFTNRLVYPVKNTDGKIVNVGGRTLDKNWKENGIRKYTYFKNWEDGVNLIYGLSDNIENVKEKSEIILFEGVKSVLLADTWGIHNTGAILTSHLNKGQMRILEKLGCRVVFALDKGVEISKDRNIKMLKQFVLVEFIYDNKNLLIEKDSPVDHGKGTWNILYEGRFVLR